MAQPSSQMAKVAVPDGVVQGWRRGAKGKLAQKTLRVSVSRMMEMLCVFQGVYRLQDLRLGEVLSSPAGPKPWWACGVVSLRSLSCLVQRRGVEMVGCRETGRGGSVAKRNRDQSL